MKNSGLKLMVMLISITMISLFSMPVSAQGPGGGRGYGQGQGPGPGNEDCLAGIPGITAEQRTAIEQLRAKQLHKSALIRAEIAEKQARLNTLKLAEKEDVKAIDGTIDDITKLRGDLMKQREAHKREIKALLNDEQKVYFDSGNGRGPGKGNGPCGGYHHGRYGKGMGYGQGYCPYAK